MARVIGTPQSEMMPSAGFALGLGEAVADGTGLTAKAATQAKFTRS